MKAETAHARLWGDRERIACSRCGFMSARNHLRVVDGDGEKRYACAHRGQCDRRIVLAQTGELIKNAPVGKTTCFHCGREAYRNHLARVEGVPGKYECRERELPSCERRIKRNLAVAP